MFEPQITLIPEVDGEFSLLAETAVPSGSFTAGKVAKGAPKGGKVGAHATALRLPLKFKALKDPGAMRLVHHRAFDLRLAAGDVLRAYLVLDHKVLGVASILVAGRAVTSAAGFSSPLVMRPPLTPALCLAVAVETTPSPDKYSGPLQQLFQLGVFDPDRARFHRLAIMKRMAQYGYTIDPALIVSGPAATVGACRNSVFQHAHA